MIFLIIITGFFVPAFADSSGTFGIILIPEKIVANSEGIIQIHTMKNNHFFPISINDIAVTSLDSSIVQILGTKNTDDFITNVKIKAIKEGTTDISIVAPGFFTQKFSVTVYGSKNNQAQLLIKTSPSNFNLNDPTKGYVSIELADIDGNPTKATNDMAVKLSPSNNNILSLQNKDIIIKKGEYFTIEEFEVKKSGIVTLYASTDKMDTVSSTITVTHGTAPLTVKLYVYPEKISSYATSYTYAIVQLQDANGNPVKATEDIPISVKVTDSILSESVNTSGEYDKIKIDGQLEIKKDSYFGYVKLITQHGLDGTYDVSISAQNYEVSSSKQLTTVDLDLLDDKYPRLDILPILATGKEELVGVLRLEDTTTNPISAKKDLPIPIDSSDSKSLLIENSVLGRGDGSSLVFGKIGLIQPDSLTLKFPSEIDQTISPQITGPTKSSLTLVAAPLISKAIDNTEFPILMYFTSSYTNANEVVYFPEDSELYASPNEYFKIENQKIQRGQGPILLNAKSLKEGLTTIKFETGEYSTTLDMESVMSKPTTISISYPESTFTNSRNIFVAQILDSQDQPLYSTQDMQIKLVTNDKSMLEVPETITIQKGEYFALFSVDAKKIGTTDLAALASNMPTSQYKINIEELTPTITLTSPDSVKKGGVVDVSLSAQYHDAILPGMNVEWHVDGATIISSDPITDANGMSQALLNVDSSGPITIDVNLSGSGYGKATTSKSINVFVENSLATEKQNLKPLNINGFDPLPLLIPGGIATGALFIKKKSIIERIKSNSQN